MDKMTSQLCHIHYPERKSQVFSKILYDEANSLLKCCSRSIFQHDYSGLQGTFANTQKFSLRIDTDLNQNEYNFREEEAGDEKVKAFKN
jgi:hypothetical protein